MIDTLLKLLKENKDVSAYEINYCKTKSAQAFYILNKLETNRYTNNKDLSVNIYHDFDEYRGSSTFVLNASDDEDTINEKINNAIQISKNVKNPYFDLVNKEDKELINVSSIKTDNLNKVVDEIAHAVIKADTYKEGWINSIEVFVNNKVSRFINSNGVDLSFEKTTLEVEMIPTWKGKDEEIELYLDIRMLSDDLDKITTKVDETLKAAKMRAEAIPYNKDMKANYVVINNDMLELLMNNFANDISYYNVLVNANHYKLNEKICDYDLDITMKAFVNDTLYSRPYDGSGKILDEIKIIEKGSVINYHGDNRFGQYLKVANPSGSYGVMEVKVSKERKITLNEPYFELLNFSSPQLDEASGYFGGEVRLALYHDDKGNIIPVTALSLSGNIYDAIKDAYYSNEEVSLNSYKGPKNLILNKFDLN